MNARFSSTTAADIEDEVGRIIRSGLPVPKGTDGEGLLRGWVEALQGMPLDAINRAVSRFLSGQFAADFSPRWCPMAPELAIMVRRCMTTEKAASQEYWYRLPRSRILRQRITRETVRQYVDAGVVPRGVIWVPGAHGKPGDRPDIGTLFGPDPLWQPAKLLDKRSQSEREADEASEDHHQKPLSPEGRAKLEEWRAKYMPNNNGRAA